MGAVVGVLFDGLAYGMLLFLLSVGLSVTLGMMNFVNLAHCTFGMIGGYTTVTLMNQAGGPLNSGNNFCNTVLDDNATALIQGISPAGNPWTGSFKPASPLAAFNGQNGNGTWTLTVSDVAAFDGGNVRAFSLAFTTFTCNSSLAVAGVGK